MTTPNEGTIFAPIRFPSTWPAHDDLVILSRPHNGGAIELLALKDGRLRFTVLDGLNNEIASFVSQAIDIIGNGFVVLSMNWSPARIELRIDGNTLLADAPGVGHLSLSPQEQPASIVLSIDRPDASAACQRWIQNRKAKFSSPKLHPTRMRFKTIGEQATDLRNSILSIQDIAQQVLAGKMHFLGMLSAELRALLYWHEDAKRDKQYNPLLLRMASKADLPLPVYRVTARPYPAIVKGADIHIEPNIPRLQSVFPTDELVDIQDWLESIAMRIDSAPSKEMSAKDLIAETAHILGAAHYDEDVSSFIDILQNTTSFDINTLTQLLCAVASITAQLADWVISELVTRKLIT